MQLPFWSGACVNSPTLLLRNHSHRRPPGAPSIPAHVGTVRPGGRVRPVCSCGRAAGWSSRASPSETTKVSLPLAHDTKDTKAILQGLSASCNRCRHCAIRANKTRAPFRARPLRETLPGPGRAQSTSWKRRRASCAQAARQVPPPTTQPQPLQHTQAYLREVRLVPAPLRLVATCNSFSSSLQASRVHQA